MSVAFTCDKCSGLINGMAQEFSAQLSKCGANTVTMLGAPVHEAKHFCYSCERNLLESFAAWRRQEKLL